MPFCPNCGIRIVENAKFCHYCGTAQKKYKSIGKKNIVPEEEIPVQEAEPAPEEKSPVDEKASSLPEMPSGKLNAGMLIWSILNTIMCCTPMGIAALIFAAKAKDAATAEEEKKKLKTAKTLNLIPTILYLILIVFYIVVIVFPFLRLLFK